MQKSPAAAHGDVATASEAFSDEAAAENSPPTPPATYDLLLDPERAFADASDFFAVFSGHD